MDLQKDILDHMGFKPVIPAGGPKPMDPPFSSLSGGLRKILEAKKSH
jgi:acyl CoA:acetate/3-ketoacid CoA transferase